jgi:L-fuculose-phosphate aldolase
MTTITENLMLAEDLTRYARLCYDRHLVGAAGGNLSVRLPGRNAFLVTASGVSLRDVAPANLLVVESNGNVLENPAGLNPSKEAGFHFGIYEVKFDVNAVIHVHPPYSTTYAVLRQPIPLATISAQLKLRQGAVVPEAPPGSAELRRNIMQAVEGAGDRVSVLLLERHGLVAYAATLREAFDDAELAEDTAKIALLCRMAASQAFA